MHVEGSKYWFSVVLLQFSDSAVSVLGRGEAGLCTRDGRQQRGSKRHVHFSEGEQRQERET